jgi:hypothetical protein
MSGRAGGVGRAFPLSRVGNGDAPFRKPLDMPAAS